MRTLKEIFFGKQKTKRNRKDCRHYLTTIGCPYPEEAHSGGKVCNSCLEFETGEEAFNAWLQQTGITKSQVDNPPVQEVLNIIQNNFNDTPFTYDDFKSLGYHEMVLSGIFQDLKERCIIRTIGFQTFELIKQKLKNEVEIDNQTSMKIQSGLKRFYEIDVSKELDNFCDLYSSSELKQIIAKIDLQLIPVKVESLGMKGMQRMKVLELSRWLKKKERNEERKACWDKLIEMANWSINDFDGVDLTVLQGLANDLIANRQDKEAIKVLNQIKSICKPGSEGHLYALGWLSATYLNMNDKQQAKQFAEQCLKYDSNNNLALEVLKRLS